MSCPCPCACPCACHVSQNIFPCHAVPKPCHATLTRVVACLYRLSPFDISKSKHWSVRATPTSFLNIIKQKLPTVPIYYGYTNYIHLLEKSFSNYPLSTNIYYRYTKFDSSCIFMQFPNTSNKGN